MTDITEEVPTSYEVKFCPRCGSIVKDGFCKRCERQITVEDERPPIR